MPARATMAVVPEWRNRQTRRSQTPLAARLYEFKSRLRHHELSLLLRPRGVPSRWPRARDLAGLRVAPARRGGYPYPTVVRTCPIGHPAAGGVRDAQVSVYRQLHGAGCEGNPIRGWNEAGPGHQGGFDPETSPRWGWSSAWSAGGCGDASVSRPRRDTLVRHPGDKSLPHGTPTEGQSALSGAPVTGDPVCQRLCRPSPQGCGGVTMSGSPLRRTRARVAGSVSVDLMAFPGT